ncbi:MAG: hypothetical protein V3W19_08990 [Desulfatiglandales bacterium]
MDGTKIIDVRGLEHAEKEGLFFPGIEGLTDNEMLRIIMELNPLVFHNARSV